MDYGVLMAIGEDGEFQVVAIASSEEEAAEQAANYLVYGPGTNSVAPERFELHRNTYGVYDRITEIKPSQPSTPISQRVARRSIRRTA